MKKIIHIFLRTLFIVPILFISQSVNALIIADGVVQSGGFSNPLAVDFEIGSNNLSFITDTNAFGPDLIQFTIEENQVLEGINLLSFISVGGSDDNKAFFGLIDATTYNPPAPGSTPGQGDLFAGMLFGAEEAGTDLLDKPIVDAFDFNLPLDQLTAGEYIFWFNETAALDIYSIDFQLAGDPDVEPVPVPAAAYLLIAPLASVLGFRRKKPTA